MRTWLTKRSERKPLYEFDPALIFYETFERNRKILYIVVTEMPKLMLEKISAGFNSRSHLCSLASLVP